MKMTAKIENIQSNNSEDVDVDIFNLQVPDSCRGPALLSHIQAHHLLHDSHFPLLLAFVYVSKEERRKGDKQTSPLLQIALSIDYRFFTLEFGKRLFNEWRHDILVDLYAYCLDRLRYYDAAKSKISTYIYACCQFKARFLILDRMAEFKASNDPKKNLWEYDGIKVKDGNEPVYIHDFDRKRDLHEMLSGIKLSELERLIIDSWLDDKTLKDVESESSYSYRQILRVRDNLVVKLKRFVIDSRDHFRPILHTAIDDGTVTAKEMSWDDLCDRFAELEYREPQPKYEQIRYRMKPKKRLKRSA
jgi:hypothetical protein